MENENERKACRCGVPGCESGVELHLIQLPSMATSVEFSRAELQAIVDQAAAKGITASPVGFSQQVQAFITGGAQVVPSQRAAS
jgi:hypothetical protein